MSCINLAQAGRTAVISGVNRFDESEGLRAHDEQEAARVRTRVPERVRLGQPRAA